MANEKVNISSVLIKPIMYSNGRNRGFGWLTDYGAGRTYIHQYGDQIGLVLEVTGYPGIFMSIQSARAFAVASQKLFPEDTDSINIEHVPIAEFNILIDRSHDIPEYFLVSNTKVIVAWSADEGHKKLIKALLERIGASVNEFDVSHFSKLISDAAGDDIEWDMVAALEAALEEFGLETLKSFDEDDASYLVKKTLTLNPSRLAYIYPHRTIY